jgi:hypothetical protein
VALPAQVHRRLRTGFGDDAETRIRVVWDMAHHRMRLRTSNTRIVISMA